ncbi:MAG: ferritin-like domain-containing protein [Alphaproteobacteria bacterium]
MANDNFHRQGEASWSVCEIPYHQLVRDRIKEDIQLLYLLASASFIEITSDLYTRNLVEFFGGDHETVGWLEQRWEPEELQHGVALKRYVQAAWPDFDWDAAYRSFFTEFSPICSMEALAPTGALVMAAQCVVETGTSSFYTMLAQIDREPVLTHLATRIRGDEVRHYKHFYRYFRKYCERERPGRIAVLGTLLKRAAAVHSEEALIAFKHVHATQNPGAEFRKSDYASYRDCVRRMAKDHFPMEMAMKLMLKPLGLGGVAGRIAPPLAASLCGLFLR